MASVDELVRRCDAFAHRRRLATLTDMCVRKDAEFNEAEHPRETDGKFTAGGSATKGENVPLSSTEQETAHKALNMLEHVPHPWQEGPENERDLIVRPQSVGFRTPAVLHLGGASKKGKEWHDVKKLSVGQMAYGQQHVPLEGIRAYVEDINRRSPELPEVAHGWGAPGEYHVMSGHTRISAQALAGRTDIPVRVFYFEKDPRTGKSKQVKAPRATK